MQADTKKQLISVGIALAAFGLIVAVGSGDEKGNWLVIPLTTILAAGAAALITRKSSLKTRIISTVGWGLGGLIASLAFHLS